MNCAACHEQLSLYIDEQMNPQERQQLEGHLEGCDRCRAELASLTLMVGSLRSAEPVTVPSLLPGIHAQLAGQPWWKGMARQFVAPWPTSLPWHSLALATAALFVIVVTTHPGISRRDEEMMQRPLLSGERWAAPQLAQNNRKAARAPLAEGRIDGVEKNAAIDASLETEIARQNKEAPKSQFALAVSNGQPAAEEAQDPDRRIAGTSAAQPSTMATDDLWRSRVSNAPAQLSAQGALGSDANGQEAAGVGGSYEKRRAASDQKDASAVSDRELSAGDKNDTMRLAQMKKSEELVGTSTGVSDSDPRSRAGGELDAPAKLLDEAGGRDGSMKRAERVANGGLSATVVSKVSGPVSAASAPAPGDATADQSSVGNARNAMEPPPTLEKLLQFASADEERKEEKSLVPVATAPTPPAVASAEGPAEEAQSAPDSAAAFARAASALKGPPSVDHQLIQLQWNVSDVSKAVSDVTAWVGERSGFAIPTNEYHLSIKLPATEVQNFLQHFSLTAAGSEADSLAASSPDAVPLEPWITISLELVPPSQ